MARKTFVDQNLRTPAHDTVMLWLDENAEAIIQNLCSGAPGFNTESFVVEKKWEHPHGGFIRGRVYFIDMLITGRWTRTWTHDGKEYSADSRYCLACEVKPVVASVGDLVRQLRQYEDHAVKKDFVWKVAVVSPDTRFKEIIEKQGFLFIQAPQPEYGPQGGLF